MLPIGSVVLLKGGKKMLMIFGRKQMSSSSSKIWDYLGCFYPEGSMGPEYCFLFEEENIDEVVFRGYSDENNAKFEKHFMDLDNKQEKGEEIPKESE